ncbi:MAG: UDP-2,4-diacetamido-2,4,6-trideoxy-beta-L-altropyranose hydrolase [Peptococcaceae bacterium]|nr:UDP-2,4-diacetamido-2,4,6-trideoxy-beta-L-altropyranose hydrolase [Peptococcaceae bacterium]
MLYIRVDGNPAIGTGHIMRCLSIADAMCLRGQETTFIVGEDHMAPLFSERGYPVVVLNSRGDTLGNALAWDTLESEIPTLTALIKSQNIKKLLIDSYFVTPAYLQKLCGLTYVAYIDDLDAFHYPCHMLINYNCYYDQFDYPRYYPQTKLLLGCQYAPLRGEFQNLSRRVLHRNVGSVLITTGGNDSRNIAGKLVRRAKNAQGPQGPQGLQDSQGSQGLKNLVFHIVAGSFNPYINELRQMEKEYEDVFIHSSVQTMSQLMLDCDIAVSAGGSTLYELCACGTPTVAFALAENQLDGVASLGNGFMISAGDVRESEELCLERILEGISHLVTNYRMRLDFSEKMQHLVDGQGALRIAGEL